MPHPFLSDRTSRGAPPTVDMQRNLDVVGPWIVARRPFLLVGPEGCGKTMLSVARGSSTPPRELNSVLDFIAPKVLHLVGNWINKRFPPCLCML